MPYRNKQFAFVGLYQRDGWPIPESLKELPKGVEEEFLEKVSLKPSGLPNFLEDGRESERALDLALDQELPIETLRQIRPDDRLSIVAATLWSIATDIDRGYPLRIPPASSSA